MKNIPEKKKHYKKWNLKTAAIPLLYTAILAVEINEIPLTFKNIIVY